VSDPFPWLVLHAAATWSLVGLIWVVQLVLYPAFGLVGREPFRHYHAAHSRGITGIVGPLMGLELASAVALLWLGEPRGVFWWSLVPLAFNWLSTGLVQVPLHERLGRGFDEAAHRRLVLTNWFRTAAWTLRGIAVAFCLGSSG
jgi:hypothetical protein